MSDLVRNQISGKAVPVIGNDIDTDRIIPARFLRCVTFDGLGEHAFEDDRLQLKEKGQTHSFDMDVYQDASILVVNKNFGCGSSREHAPQSIMRWNKGIKAIVGESFAEIFFGNCITLGVPCVTAAEGDVSKLQKAIQADPQIDVEVDLEKKEVRFGDQKISVVIPDGPRQQFLEGRWDSTSELLAAVDEVKKTADALPYVSGW